MRGPTRVSTLLFLAGYLAPLTAGAEPASPPSQLTYEIKLIYKYENEIQGRPVSRNGDAVYLQLELANGVIISSATQAALRSENIDGKHYETLSGTAALPVGLEEDDTIEVLTEFRSRKKCHAARAVLPITVTPQGPRLEARVEFVVPEKNLP